ncbi:hypothetical protein LP422_12840 [Janibacter limosus]|uniref:Uncharacterized protein n=1 Tax=Janibacter limosus TaxID=53458 RepID=A0AC61U144_9MICO|nr:DUF6406 domain-containing protein [Janibacter limosus]UUZ43720.1 hypothetical protein LP422_12840 [Janibacter limosus]
MDETITLQQNIPTPAWGLRLVAANVRGGLATLYVEATGESAVKHQVTVGDTVPVGDRQARVEAITGGGHDGPPGRAAGRLTLALVEEPA